MIKIINGLDVLLLLESSDQFILQCTNSIMKYKRALFPTTLTNDSLESLAEAISYCIDKNLELYILYAYRLIAHESNPTQNLKKEIENKASFIFNKLEEELLKNSGIKYYFFSEVGFINDRVKLTMESHHIDCVLLSKSLFETLKPDLTLNDGQYKLINRPIVII